MPQAVRDYLFQSKPANAGGRPDSDANLDQAVRTLDRVAQQGAGTIDLGESPKPALSTSPGKPEVVEPTSPVQPASTTLVPLSETGSLNGAESRSGASTELPVNQSSELREPEQPKALAADSVSGTQREQHGAQISDDVGELAKAGHFEPAAEPAQQAAEGTTLLSKEAPPSNPPVGIILDEFAFHPSDEKTLGSSAEPQSTSGEAVTSTSLDSGATRQVTEAPQAQSSTLPSKSVLAQKGSESSQEDARNIQGDHAPPSSVVAAKKPYTGKKRGPKPKAQQALAAAEPASLQPAASLEAPPAASHSPGAAVDSNDLGVTAASQLPDDSSALIGDRLSPVASLEPVIESGEEKGVEITKVEVSSSPEVEVGQEAISGLAPPAKPYSGKKRGPKPKEKKAVETPVPAGLQSLVGSTTGEADVDLPSASSGPAVADSFLENGQKLEEEQQHSLENSAARQRGKSASNKVEGTADVAHDSVSQPISVGSVLNGDAAKALVTDLNKDNRLRLRSLLECRDGATRREIYDQHGSIYPWPMFLATLNKALRSYLPPGTEHSIKVSIASEPLDCEVTLGHALRRDLATALSAISGRQVLLVPPNLDGPPPPPVRRVRKPEAAATKAVDSVPREASRSPAEVAEPAQPPSVSEQPPLAQVPIKAPPIPTASAPKKMPRKAAPPEIIDPVPEAQITPATSDTGDFQVEQLLNSATDSVVPDPPQALTEKPAAAEPPAPALPSLAAEPAPAPSTDIGPDAGSGQGREQAELVVADGDDESDDPSLLNVRGGSLWNQFR